MGNTFTNEQLRAIESEGKTIVSASAGSGKTTVMIEKIIRLIKSGCEVGEILAVTFTKKAASQMKEKLCKAIIKAINAKETTAQRKASLKRQLAEVPTADISTIHSFCSKLIRSHFYVAGVDNAFRVIGSEDAEGTALKNEALDQLLDEAYEEGDGQFLSLLSTYWRKKSDNTLRRIFLTTYEELRCRADYREYLRRSGEYTEQTFDAVCVELLAILKDKCEYYLHFGQEEKAYFEACEGLPQIALASELEGALKAVINSSDYFEACALQKPKFTSKRTSKKDGEDKLFHIERLAALKAKVVKIYDDELLDTLSREEEKANFLRAGETAAALSAYLLRFDEKYEELKTERGVLDYNDLEHKALALLSMEEIATEMKEKYRYVFVDEYQDVNPVQEAIISKIGGDNLFLVGDVKQSIYGFRGSKSKFFVEKQAEFERIGGDNLKLTRNFRSSDAVLDAVNTQFSLAMTKRTSQIDYAIDSFMNRGGRYALNDGRVQLHRLLEEEKKAKEERGVYSVKERAGKKKAEENTVAKTVRQIIEDELNCTWFDADEGINKRVRYADIAVLSRKKQGRISKTVAALSEEGIPVTSASSVNICEFSEIKTLIDILSLLDNAEQDVPLCSALLSAMGNLTADELTAIRLAFKEEKYFRRACKRYAEERMDASDSIAYKLRRFYAYFEQLRDLSCVMDAGELLTKLLIDTRMESRLLSRENGNACLRRIHRFIEETTAEESLSVHAFLERLKDLDYKIECSENGGENSVKVLTMHSSKGLEYPIVIIDNLNAPFKGVDKDDVLVEEQFGLAPRAYDGKRMLKKDTLLRRLHEKREQQNSIADELNLYYVALTRAKYGLHILYTEPTFLSDVRYAKSFADFTDFRAWEGYHVHDEIFNVPKQDRTALAFNPDETLAKSIMRAFTWQYTHGGFENLPVKSSATGLMSDDALWASVSAFDKQPTQTEEEIVLETQGAEDENTRREEGLAYHAFLENFDFGLLYDDNSERMDKASLRTVIEAALEKSKNPLLSIDKLVEILSNPVFYELKDMRLYKEQQFLVSLPVKETYAKKKGFEGLLDCEGGEEMLFQGAIDLLVVGEDEVRIIDYKYSQRGAESIKEHYQKQLNLYRLAVSKITGTPKENIRCSIVNIDRGYQVDIQ